MVARYFLLHLYIIVIVLFFVNNSFVFDLTVFLTIFLWKNEHN